MKKTTNVRRVQLAGLLLASFLFASSIYQPVFTVQEVSAQTTYKKQSVDQYGTITYEHYRLHESLDGQKVQKVSEQSYLNQTFLIKESYHKGIETYYLLETNQGETLGFIQSSSVVLTQEKSEGQKQVIVETKTITMSGVAIYSDFLWKKKDVTDELVGEDVRLKGAYHHFNGKVYYDAYDLKNKSLGLIPEEAFDENQATTETSEVEDEAVKEKSADSVEQEGQTNETTEEIEEVIQESVTPDPEQTLPNIPVSAYLLGGQTTSARVRRAEEQTSVAQPRNFYAATYKNKNEFVEQIAKDAQEVANQYGLYPSVMIAQAILESAYGESQLTKEANNFFGIKFTVGSDEDRFGRYDIHSDEFVNGKRVSLAASFRKYPTAKASLEDNGKLLAQGLSWNRNFYQASWRKNAPTYKEATKGLTGKYATDPLYDSKLNQLIENWNLSQYD